MLVLHTLSAMLAPCLLPYIIASHSLPLHAVGVCERSGVHQLCLACAMRSPPPVPHRASHPAVLWADPEQHDHGEE